MIVKGEAVCHSDYAVKYDGGGDFQIVSEVFTEKALYWVCVARFW